MKRGLPMWVEWLGIAAAVSVVAGIPLYWVTPGRVDWRFPCLLAAAYVVLVALLLVMWEYLIARPKPGHCRRCGYDLTGNVSGVCPECGTQVKPTNPTKGTLS